MKHSSPSDLFARLAELLEEDAAASRDRTLRPTRSGRLAAAGRRLTDFDSAHQLSDLLDAAAVLLKEGQVRGANPRYFGFFRGAPDLSTTLAEALTAWFDPQLALRVEARDAVALEAAVADRLGEGLGFRLEPEGASAQFTTGASASNSTAVLCALAARFEDFESAGLVGKPPLAIYASVDAHGSLEKAVVAAGLGREALERIAVDDDRRLRPDALEAQIAVDRRRGREPLAVVATHGTTAAGAVDPVETLADLAAREGLYLHVDAAWGGLAGWCPRGLALTQGLHRVDSLAVDLHKTIGLPTGQGLLFLRDRKLATRLFSPRDAAYMPAVNEKAEDPYRTTPLWSRRFQGLAAAFRLLTLGRQGLETSLDRLFALADRLEEKLREAGWRPRRHSELPLVLFEDPESPAPAEEIARRVRRRGKVWLAAVHVGGRSWLRAAFSHFETRESDLEDLISELQAVRSDLRRGAK